VGNVLPVSLRREFVRALKHDVKYTINIYGDIKNRKFLKDDKAICKENPKMPKEFYTDEWWKKRGL
jgi:hypothetical protein